MNTKDKLVFALYVATSVAVVAHSGVEIWKTFKSDKPMRRQIKEAKKDN
jgi:hypothetical protein